MYIELHGRNSVKFFATIPLKYPNGTAFVPIGRLTTSGNNTNGTALGNKNNHLRRNSDTQD